MGISFISLLLLLALGAAQEALAVVVYRFPEGRFSSGDVTKDRLRPTGEIRNFTWVQSRFNRKEFWISRNSVITAMDFSRRALATVSTPYYRQPFVVAKPQGHFLDLTTVEILTRKENWFKIAFRQNGKFKQAWVPENSIQTDPHDAGLCLTQMSLPLKSAPDSDAPTLLTIPEGTHLTPEGLHNSWVKVRYLRKIGWVSFYKILSKLNFAKRVQIKRSSNPQEVVSVSGNWLTLGDNSMVSLDQVQALETDPFQVIVGQKISRGLDLPSSGQGATVETLGFGQRLDVLQTYDVVWVRAGDGEGNGVWYRPKSLPLAEESYDHEKTVSFADLQRRGIYDMALDPKNSNLRFASAKGIFKTTDGVHWKALPYFENQNQPVAISESGEIYVGSLVSHNRGETFNPYLRWDNVIGRIVRVRGYMPDNLRLIKVACAREGLKITLGFGKRSSLGSLELISKDHGRHWTYGALKTQPQVSSSLRRAVPFVSVRRPLPHKLAAK